MSAMCISARPFAINRHIKKYIYNIDIYFVSRVFSPSMRVSSLPVLEIYLRFKPPFLYNKSSVKASVNMIKET